MINNITIKNYKSINKIDLDLGRINVFIGENGSGKSNILEAIALAGAAESNKLDNEFLASRGIRVSTPELMRSAFLEEKSCDPIQVSMKSDENIFEYNINNDNKPYSTWKLEPQGNGLDNEYSLEEFKKAISNLHNKKSDSRLQKN
ncbi:AAA family ATPase [Acetobacter senegalensis]|uniref:AAA family ATPase n=1 Tax=Acetobacter senegalensis TaxID=446692 RepID=UPI00073F7D81|nr:AAA family ATPase [Acetobacter senegalensis]